MPLHLVGETIDALTAHRKARDGGIVQVARGIYLDADGDADSILREYAVRIARYIYPAAYLSAASALELAPTSDGRLFIGGRRNQRTRLRSLEIIQTKAPPKPSLDKAVIGDPLGEFTIPVSSPEQRLLEAFRMRSEQANSLTEDMRRATAERLIAEHGSPVAASDKLWTLARANDWYREGEGAERYLRGSLQPVAAPRNKAAFALRVTWHGQLMGFLSHDGHEWRWSAQKVAAPPLIRETLPGTLPPFIESLLPEGWLAQVLRDEDQRSVLRHGRRYMSNITIAENKAEQAQLPADIMQGRLSAFSKDGVFTGSYQGPGRDTIDQSFEANLAKIFATGSTPRLSGVQIKAPMCLDDRGILAPATDLPFTHILKPAGTSGFEQMPVVEWMCLELGRCAGFTVPAAVLVPMPDGMPPALLVERFDIRETPADERRLALEDFCSILGVPAEDKYKGTIERMARALRGLSTAPDEDIANLYARALFAWLIADGDMHLKNIAVLKIAGPTGRSFQSIRMAPLYDALTTRVFPGLGDDHMALKISGKDDRLNERDFETAARTMDLPLGTARNILNDMCEALIKGLDTLQPPEIISGDGAAMMAVRTIIDIARSRIAAIQQKLAPEDDWESNDA